MIAIRTSPSGVVALTLFSVASTTGCASAPSDLYSSMPYLAPGRSTLAADREHEPAREGGRATTLRELLDALLTHSPSIASQRAQYRAAIERVPQASAPPDPELMLTWLPEPVETRVGPNTLRVQLVQMLPFPSKLVARGDEAAANARAAAIAFDRVTRDEVTRLKVLYADYCYLWRAIAAVTQSEGIAKALSELAAQRYQEARGQLFDVSKAQSQLAQLGYDRLRLSEQLDVAAAQLAAAIGDPGGLRIGEPEALPLIEVAVDPDTLFRTALAHQHELRELDEKIRAGEAKVSQANARWLPDLSIGVQYLVNGEARMPNVADSGADAVGVMLGLSLPIWLGKNAAGVDEAEWSLRATMLAKKAAIDRLEADVAQALFTERDARRLRVLYDEHLLPQAQSALENSEQWYRALPERFSDFLEARGVLYSFTLARERAVADHFKAVARLEALIGATLTGQVTP